MKAIETKYKGYRFRSRLEARYAVFFDAIPIPWTYEEQGYDLGEAGWYLPDFRVKAAKFCFWVEIKPDEPSVEEAFKCYELARQSDETCLISAGVPGEEKIWLFSLMGNKVHVLKPETTKCSPVWCDLFGLTTGGRVTKQTSNAYEAARSARFEHGKH